MARPSDTAPDDPPASAPAPPAPPAGPRRARRATSTSNFGVSRRESHDSSGFYARFGAPRIDVSGTPAGPEVGRDIDDIVLGDARDMAVVPDDSVALVVTSPPYFAGKAYEEAMGEGHIPASYLEYLDMLTAVFAECVRCLEPGGRMAVNVANLGRRPYRSLSADVTGILQDRLGLLLRGEVIWQKQRGAGGNCAWGSFQRPGNPVLRDTTERVVIASKGRFDRALSPAQRARRGLPSVATINRDEFMDATLDVWEFPAESATRVGHPAPFPVALPERLIQLHTYEGDLVLDPFVGSGTTAVAAVRTGRHWVGYDADPAYVEVARERLASEVASAVTRASVRGAPRSHGGRVGAALDGGHSIRDLAAAVLAEAGVADPEVEARVPGGVQVTFSARGRDGRPVHFDVCGSLSSSRGGLSRADVLWRAIGKAAVVHGADPAARVVLLAADVPDRGTSAARSLAAVTGAAGPVTAVVDLLATVAVQQVQDLLA